MTSHTVNQAAFARPQKLDLRHGEFVLMHAEGMSYVEGGDYHEKHAWAFGGIPSALNHTVAHLLLGQALHIIDPKTQPLDYQGSFDSEIFVFAIEILLDRMREKHIAEGSILRDPAEKKSFINDVQKSYYDTYNRETRIRVILWRLGEIEGPVKGKTYEAVRLLMKFDDFNTRDYAAKRGVRFISNMDLPGKALVGHYQLPVEKFSWWFLDAGAGKPHYYAGMFPDQSSHLPKGSNGIEDFKPFICPSPEKIGKIYDLVAPAVIYVAKQLKAAHASEENRDINGYNLEHKVLDTVTMAEVYQRMRLIHRTPKILTSLVQTIG